VHVLFPFWPVERELGGPFFWPAPGGALGNGLRSAFKVRQSAEPLTRGATRDQRLSPTLASLKAPIIDFFVGCGSPDSISGAKLIDRKGAIFGAMRNLLFVHSSSPCFRTAGGECTRAFCREYGH
jgi:hypothetical protein